MPKCENKECYLWESGRDEDDCDECVDGRDTEVVSDYASTCDGCGELTLHEEMKMNEETQLGYCEKCVGEMSSSEKENLKE
jgi:hypothetical protein